MCLGTLNAVPGKDTFWNLILEGEVAIACAPDEGAPGLPEGLSAWPPASTFTGRARQHTWRAVLRKLPVAVRPVTR